jgi:hypothetical protein
MSWKCGCNENEITFVPEKGVFWKKLTIYSKTRKTQIYQWQEELKRWGILKTFETFFFFVESLKEVMKSFLEKKLKSSIIEGSNEEAF